MISRQELKELASYILTDAYFVTLYLNVDPTHNPKDEWRTQYKNLMKTEIAKLPPADRRLVSDDFNRLERYITDLKGETKRGLAIITCASHGFWWVYHSQVPFDNILVIKHDPFIKPLMQQIDIYQRYLIVIVSGNEARLYIAGMGRIEPVFYVERPAVKYNRSKDGGWGDMGAIRAERKRDASMKMMIRGAAAAMEDIMENERIKRVLLGGSVTARARFRDTLPPHFAERLVGEFPVKSNPGEKEILERAIPEMKKIELNFERKAIEELFDKVGLEGGGSVLGLSDTLTALQQGNVRKLFVMSNMIAPGKICEVCSALTPPRDRPCPYCNGKMIDIPYIFDHAISRAIEQGARVDMLQDAPELVRVGGIGALLRY